MATKAAFRQFHPRLSLIGAPGSGKGSYGRILAQHWQVPLVSVSDVLRQRQCEAIQEAKSAGKLVDDEIVSEVLMEHFTKEDAEHKGFILDGFPRTIQQVQLMEGTWPTVLQVQAAIHLNVPAEICERKLLGRRICTICGNHYNVNHVISGGFDLPAQLPRPGECHNKSHNAPLPQRHQLSRCDPDVHWKRRDDDEKHIVHHRLEVYTRHTEPILEYFRKKRSLFQFTPYKGYEDMPKFQSELEQWLASHLPETVDEAQ